MVAIGHDDPATKRGALRAAMALVLVCAIAIVASACDTPTPSMNLASPSPSTVIRPSDDSAIPTNGESAGPIVVNQDVPVACTNLPFPPDRLLTKGAEAGEDAPAAALRDVLARDEGFIDGVPFPDTGWSRVVQTPGEVQFTTLETRPEWAGVWYLIAFRLRNGVWMRSYTGECRLHPILPNGFRSGEWWLTRSPEPSATSLKAVVREPACVVGPPRPDWIGQPIVVVRSDSLKVVIPVRQVGAECRVGPTPITIDLGQPVGNRPVLDGSVFPPHPAGTSPP